MESPFRIVIVGAVACGPKTASRLRRLMPGADITVVEKDSLLSYGACGLPYYVAGEFSNIHALTHTQVGLPRTSEFFRDTKGFTVLSQTEALSIDRGDKTLLIRSLESGEERRLPYDKLVLATGGTAFRPPLPGIDLKNVWFMTHPEHARSLVEEISSRGYKKAIMVGAGFIGVEMTEALIYKDMDVALVEMADQIMPGVMDKDMAAYAAQHMDDNDVTLVLGERVVGINADESGEAAVSVSTDKRTVEGDCVIVAVGTRPNDKLAREAGLSCTPRGGIIVNSNCRTSDPDIYAGGDCVVNDYVSRMVSDPLFVPLGSTANKHGRVIANHIAGRPTPFRGINGTGVVKCFDFTIGRTGMTEAMARQQGIDYEAITWGGPDMPHYMKDARYFLIKILADRKNRRLLGVQVAGAGQGAKRLDVAAATLYYGGTIDELAELDLAYAPPFAPPLDPIAVAAHILVNKMEGLARSISVVEARARMDAGDVVLLDVREPDENKMVKMPYDDIIHIPLGELRSRMDELPRDKDILTFCKISLRGYEAQLILNAGGYDRVWFIEGGHEAWPYGLDYLGM
ncbi:MAG: pyridine nucleotide-disulfide oxidoreductase [Desulfobacterales bacterium]|nr:MAG: pyridine nucleotide-disulfide oxidoreductase [Desulfobacterales bacterium]